MTNSKCVLCILDGWGLGLQKPDNAIHRAATPNWDRLWHNQPRSSLHAHGEAIGLPKLQIGNSEVGHQTIGSGRRCVLDLPRINKAIADGSLVDFDSLHALIAAVKAGTSRLHIITMLSEGGIHNDWRHTPPLIDIFTTHGLDVVIHGVLDGRDTPPQSALETLKEFLAKCPGHTPATLSGRYFAMDRDQNWSRTLQTYHTIHDGVGPQYQDPIQAITAHYQHNNELGNSDEFLTPMCQQGYTGIGPGDSLLMTNFRSDRARQIMHLFAQHTNSDDLVDVARSYPSQSQKKGISKNATETTINRPHPLAAVFGMTNYGNMFANKLGVLFPPIKIHSTLGEILSQTPIRQFRLAETEKYAHVTYFFNGGNEQPFDHEDRLLIPSPKVPTFDLMPQMAAPEIAAALTHRMEVAGDKEEVIVVNFANGDMVGHTGKIDAAIHAAEVLDKILGNIERAAIKNHWTVFVTADHGNFELMWDKQTNQPHTAHTLNMVPWFMLGPGCEDVRFRPQGDLTDIAPTLLDFMKLPIPSIMTGKSLFESSHVHNIAKSRI